MFPGEEESTGSQIQAGNLCLERLRLRAPNTVLMECRNKSLWGRGYGIEMIHNFSIKPSWLLAMCYPWNLSRQSDQSRCVAVPYVVLGGNSSLPFFLASAESWQEYSFMPSGWIWEDWRGKMNTERSGEQKLTFGLKNNRLRRDHWSNVQTPLSFVLEINTMGRSECLQPIWELRQKGRISRPGRNMWHPEDKLLDKYL